MSTLVTINIVLLYKTAPYGTQHVPADRSVLFAKPVFTDRLQYSDL